MINVCLAKTANFDAFKELLDSKGFSYTQGVALKRFFVVDTSEEAFTLINHPDVIAAEDAQKASLDYIDEPYTYEYGGLSWEVPDAPPYGEGWAKARICRRKNPFKRAGRTHRDEMQTSYRSSRTGVGVDIYICDIGYAPHLPTFEDRITHLEPELGGAYVTTAGSSHGVSVAACAAGKDFGIATDSLIWFAPIGTAAPAREVLAVDACVVHYLSRAGTNRPAVMNCSFSNTRTSVPSPGLAELIGDVIDLGISVTSSASNYNDDLDTLNFVPPEVPGVVCVGATAIHDTPMCWHRYGSAYGTSVAIWAPGEKVRVPHSDNLVDGVYLTNGTSFSAPFVAGIIACMLQGYQRPTTREQVLSIRSKLIENSTKGVLDFNATSRCVIRGNDNLAYLDPHVTIEPIPGLTPL